MMEFLAAWASNSLIAFTWVMAIGVLIFGAYLLITSISDYFDLDWDDVFLGAVALAAFLFLTGLYTALRTDNAKKQPAEAAEVKK